MHRRQDDETLLVLLDEAIHRLVLVLVEPHLLPDARQVHADWWVANNHLERDFAHFSHELLDLICCCLIAVTDG
jgi:hypothetical protein